MTIKDTTAMSTKRKLKLITKLKRKKRILREDKQVQSERKNILQESALRMAHILRIGARKKQYAQKPQRKPTVPDDNMDIEFGEGAKNFLSDLFSPLLSTNSITVFLSCVFGYYFKQYFLEKKLSEYRWHHFLLTFFFACLSLFVLIAFIYAFEDKYNFISNNKDNNKYWLSKSDILSLNTLLPWSVCEPEVETANWLNGIVARLWSLFEANLKKIVLDKVRSNSGSLTKVIPFLKHINYHTEFRVRKTSLGTHVPSITGVHVMRFGVKREQVVIDFELTFDGHVHLEICGAFKLVAGIKKLYFRTNVRMILGPFFREKPSVGSVWVTLLNTPIIRWRFVGVLKFLNSSWITSLVSKVIANVFKNPKRLEIKIAKYVPLRERNYREPHGLICVDVIEAVNLPPSNIRLCCTIAAKCDSYCVVVVEEDEKYTEVIHFTDNPEWNKSFTFVYHQTTRTGNVEIFVYDENFESDDLIGIIVVPIENIISQLNGREFYIPLRDAESGEVVYNQSGKESLMAVKISFFSLSGNIEKLNSSNRLARNMPVAALSVVIDYATGLESVAKQVQSPELRLLVKVNVGNQTQTTSIKERTGYPVWEESLHFLLYSPSLEVVHIEVIDVYWVIEKSLNSTSGKMQKEEKSHLASKAQHGNVLGYITLPISNVLECPKMKFEGLYQLEGHLENAYIKVLMATRITELSQEVIDNYSKPRMQFPEDLKQELKQKSIQKMISPKKSARKVAAEHQIRKS